jgi:phosphatidate cytidylyltransferase
MLTTDPELRWLLEGVVALLVLASAIGYWFSRTKRNGDAQKVIRELNARIRAWWVMCAVFALALLTGLKGTVVLFALISFLALREFITLTPTRRGDHRTLFWVFFLFVPIQYLLVAMRWYGLFTIFIPVYAFLFIPVRSAITGDLTSFLERAAKIQWGLMICVYCVSHAPALLILDIKGYSGQEPKLLLFLVLVAQLSDVLQYVFGKTLGKHKIAPQVSPNKTIEGFVGGIITTTVIGALLWWATPFKPWQAGLLSLAITLAGFAGGLCMSAIKRDRGIKDFGTMISGHGGILDRIDSICFSAPVFFHLVRYFFT